MESHLTCERAVVVTDSRKTRNLSEKKRRDQFNTLVNELSAIVSTTSRKMDKSAVLRSTIGFLKNFNGQLAHLDNARIQRETLDNIKGVHIRI